MSKPTAPKTNKSAWIRSQPATTSAKDLVKQGKAAGIKLSVAQVYTARANAKKKGAPAGKPGPKPKVVTATASGHDQHFVSLVLDLGLSKAEALLQRIRDRVREL
ncbi:MAG TPA: hypothetical protein VF331_10710 [Polyangiales bacterium]